MQTSTSFDFKDAAALLEEEIVHRKYSGKPQSLYEPINYIMGLGGKRMRPILALLGCYIYNDDYAQAKNVALAVEVFHNFTLMHDDIMDEAPIRRGQPTVHEKWNASTAILSGDIMLVKAYELLSEIPPALLPKALALFNRCAGQVCEGQQIDMDFEERQDVGTDEYINMIALKTAVLLGFSLEIGALIGGATETQAEALRQYGTKLGVGFQLKDDLLDVYGDQEKVGKQVGGDIISNKKTFLLIKAKELAIGETKKELETWLNKTDFDKKQKVEAVTAIYNTLGIKELAEQEMQKYFTEAFGLLENIEASDEKKTVLKTFSQAIIDRIK